jgi:hypothetical protein
MALTPAQIAATDVTSAVKQGLGIKIISDGQLWPCKISDGGTLSTALNKLDATHSGSRGFKQEVFEELKEAISMELTCFFDPTLEEVFEAFGDGAGVEKEIFIVFPRTISSDDVTPRESGYIYAATGFLAVGEITMALDGLMTCGVTVTGGTTNPIIVREKLPTGALNAIVTTEVQFASASLAGATSEDPILVATLSVTGKTNAQGPVLFYDFKGADAGDYILVGREVYAVTAVSAGAATLTVSASTIAGLETSVPTSAAYKIDDETVAITIT